MIQMSATNRYQSFVDLFILESYWKRSMHLFGTDGLAWGPERSPSTWLVRRPVLFLCAVAASICSATAGELQRLQLPFFHVSVHFSLQLDSIEVASVVQFLVDSLQSTI